MTRNKVCSTLIDEAKMHFRTLDSWRGVAALLVALFHLNVYSALYSLDFVRNGYLFVDFFFVLSGFVITHSYAHRLGTPEELGAFAIKRLGRLWPLHVVVLLAFVIAESGKALMAARGASFFIPPFTGPNSLDTIAMNLVFAQSIGIVPHLTWNPPSWSISAEFWTYLIFAATLLVAATWLWRVRFAAGILVATLLVGSVAILLLFARHGIDATYDLGLARCLYGFLVGYLTYRLWQTVSRVKVRAGLLEPVALVAVLIFVSSVRTRRIFVFCAARFCRFRTGFCLRVRADLAPDFEPRKSVARPDFLFDLHVAGLHHLQFCRSPRLDHREDDRPDPHDHRYQFGTGK